MKGNVHILPRVAKDNPILSVLAARISHLERQIADKMNEMDEIYVCYSDLYYEFNPEEKVEALERYYKDPEAFDRVLEDYRAEQGWFVDPVSVRIVPKSFRGVTEQSLATYLNERLKYLSIVLEQVRNELDEIRSDFIELYWKYKPEEAQRIKDECESAVQQQISEVGKGD